MSGNGISSKYQIKDSGLVVIVLSSFRNEIIRFKVESNDANKFTTADYLFFHSPHRDMIFKADIKKIENGAIYALFPSLIKLTEARIEKRESYGVNGYQNAKISYQDKHNEKITIEVSILDSSSSGLAVMVSDAVGHDLNINDKIKVHEVTLDVTKIVRIYVIRSKVVMDKVRPDTIFYRLGLELFA